MKSEEFKKIIKEAVREVFIEEMKEILLEAVKAPKTIVGSGGYGTVTESYVQPANSKPIDPIARKALMSNILGEMATGKTMTTEALTTNTFNPRGGDAINGNLPDGNVGLDQIMGLLNK
jgi:hypothetical protein